MIARWPFLPRRQPTPQRARRRAQKRARRSSASSSPSTASMIQAPICAMLAWFAIAPAQIAVELALEPVGVGAQRADERGVCTGIEQHAGEVDARGRQDRAGDDPVAVEQAGVAQARARRAARARGRRARPAGSTRSPPRRAPPDRASRDRGRPCRAPGRTRARRGPRGRSRPAAAGPRRPRSGRGLRREQGAVDVDRHAGGEQDLGLELRVVRDQARAPPGEQRRQVAGLDPRDRRRRRSRGRGRARRAGAGAPGRRARRRAAPPRAPRPAGRAARRAPLPRRARPDRSARSRNRSRRGRGQVEEEDGTTSLMRARYMYRDCRYPTDSTTDTDTRARRVYAYILQLRPRSWRLCATAALAARAGFVGFGVEARAQRRGQRVTEVASTRSSVATNS